MEKKSAKKAGKVTSKAKLTIVKAKPRRYSFRISNKLSGMLLAAVADKNAIAVNPHYRLNMGVWHNPDKALTRRKPVCEVCMAGAVLAMRSKAPADELLSAWSCDSERLTLATRRKMVAINWMRIGSMKSAVAEMHIRPTAEQKKAVVRAGDLIARAYDHDTDLAPDSVYTEAAAILAEAGL